MALSQPPDGSTKIVRWAIVGPGRAGARFAQGLAAVNSTVLHAVWGRNPQKTSAFARQFGIPHALPIREPLTLQDLASSPVDAVYIATHPDTHAALSIQALEAGKHVLCEKPAVLNAAQLAAILDAARRADRLFMEAMKPPFFPLYRHLLVQLESDPIGPVGFVRAGHADSTRPPDYPLFSPELAGGGIMGIGPYEAFLALAWLGDFKSMQVMGRVGPTGVDTLALIQSEHQRGMAQLHTGLDLLSRGDAILSAPRGYVLLHANWWNPVRASIHYREGRVVELHEPFAAGGFNYETDHFCQLLREGRRESPVISHALSIGMARMLESARAALGVRFPAEDGSPPPRG